MNYYINGIWKNDDGDDAQTSFLSAKQSCVAFENALISERNNVYATFKDQITNYLDDELAKLIRKEAKDQTSIAQAFNTLKQTDTQNQIDSMQAQNQLAQLKADAAIASAESLAQLQEANKQLVELFKDKLQSKCTSWINGIDFASVLSGYAGTSSGKISTLISNLSNLKVCLNTNTGEVAEMDLPDTESGVKLNIDKNRYADFVLGDIDAKYGYMLQAGATSFWETLSGEKDFGGAGSLCHGWSAMPIYYYHLLEQVRG